MNRSAQEILEDARRLPATEFNWLLGEMLQQSNDPANEQLAAAEADAAWDAEIKRRLNEIDSGAVRMIPGEEVLARMDARLKARREQVARQR